MNALKKLLTIKGVAIITVIVAIFIMIIAIISAITGVSMGYETIQRQASEIKEPTTVVNNQIYAQRYKNLLNKFLVNQGYVSLERLIFYLQRTHNILDITTLSDEIWMDAYIKNLNPKKKQMIPIKTICKSLKTDTSIPSFTTQSGINENGILINVIDLCTADNNDITNSNDYSERYPYLPYMFPLKSNFSVTSIVFESRNVDLGLPEGEQERVNYHSGWDFAVDKGSSFYSVCDGTIDKVVNTQNNDLPYPSSGNKIGNFILVNCNNGLRVGYYHIQFLSVPYLYTQSGSPVHVGAFLGKTSTTGLSTGPHLHLELRKDGTILDALEYIDFNYKT